MANMGYRNRVLHFLREPHNTRSRVKVKRTPCLIHALSCFRRRLKIAAMSGAWPCGLKNGSSAMAVVLRRRQSWHWRESCW
jgi:hypothetical protein